MPTTISGVQFWAYDAGLVIDSAGRPLAAATISVVLVNGSGATVRSIGAPNDVIPALSSSAQGIRPAILISAPEVVMDAGGFAQVVATSEVDDLVSAAILAADRSAAAQTSAASSATAASAASSSASAVRDTSLEVVTNLATGAWPTPRNAAASRVILWRKRHAGSDPPRDDSGVAGARLGEEVLDLTALV